MKRKALIFGGTGLVGRQLIQQLTTKNFYSEIIVFSRTPQSIEGAKMVKVTFDEAFLTQNILPESDIYCCIGTTRSEAGSKKAQYAVDHDLPVLIAQCAAKVSIHRFCFISSLGATVNSSNFYLRTKGETEQELINLLHNKVYIVRPSLLIGKRAKKRATENISAQLLHLISPLLIGSLINYRPIEDKTVAIAMYKLLTEDHTPGIYLSNTLQLLAFSHQ